VRTLLKYACVRASRVPPYPGSPPPPSSPFLFSSPLFFIALPASSYSEGEVTAKATQLDRNQNPPPTQVQDFSRFTSDMDPICLFGGIVVFSRPPRIVSSS